MSTRVPLEASSRSHVERSVNGNGQGIRQLSLLDLPGEIILKVFQQLRPIEPVTSYNSTSKKPDVSRDFFQSRASLTNVVLVSRLFYELGTPYLYRTVLLSDQVEVLLFFRTISTCPDRRPLVRSLAWVTVLSTDDTNRQSTMIRQHEADSLVVDCWDLIKDSWPLAQIDFRVAKLMGIYGPDTMETWRLLGAILALCPKIASLFLLHGCEDVPEGSYMRFSPEMRALEPLLWRYEEADGHGNPGFLGPSGYGFLADLQHLIIETHEDEQSQDRARFVIFFFLANSPRLRRVEIKGNLCHRGIWACFTQYPNSKLVADSVKELVLMRTQGPRDDIMATMLSFPKLVSLQAEYDDASYMFNTTITPALPFTISSALLRLADTLETLSLTTGPTSYGHWSYIEDYPPSLTSLSQMSKLKDLTTESMWLFGRQDVGIALQIPHLLPPSLVRFRLIDYWGTTHDTPRDYQPDSLKYYPDFPNQWTTAEFYSNVLMSLVRDSSPSLPDLGEVTLVSKQLYEEMPASDSQGEQDPADITEGHKGPLSNVSASLRAVGVQLNLEMPVESEAADRFDWARIE
ncbi:hypothetical protein KVR01_013280 [Diaporthe batatas]|uniref:uncharacterized protein n=1 Tax=Diaporthe batatas TaxID=748121 RepID=UPI001D03C5FD|nr:uncharacterized protein KVR01_013280 [Diaporthe batatas]KAG8156867.1 hypothetical protein KVR01_013280 [Diaporthe batatas]